MSPTPAASLRERLWKYRGFALYTFLNYVDKILAVAVPLVVLWLTRDRALYNRVEYIYAVSSVVVVLTELGLRNYLLYGYRDSADREQFVRDGENHFILLNTLYAAAGLVTLLALRIRGGPAPEIVLLVWIRTLYSAAFSFYSIYFRLKDRPSSVFSISIGANLSACILVALAWACHGLTLPLVFLSQAGIVLWLCLECLRRRLHRTFAAFGAYVIKAFRYGWPIILNVFVAMAVQNFGKIYAQNALSPQEMTQISLDQRVSLIIQLGHASASGYLSKQLFLETGRGVNRRILALYTLMLGLGLVLVFLALPIINHILSVRLSMGDPVFLLLMGYTVLWCLTAFFELYVNRVNKNIFIPACTLVGGLVFASVSWSLSKYGLLGIGLGMVSGMIVNFGLLVGFLQFHWRDKADA